MVPANQVSLLGIFVYFVYFTFGVFSNPLNAQEATPKVPIPVEFLVGNNRMFYQMVVKRKFTPESKLGFLSVSALSFGYDNNLEDLDMAVPALITYNFYKGIGVVGGATINNKVGAAPLLGIQHSFANKEWVSVTIVSLFLNATRNLEIFGIYEYKPSITQNVKLYNRIQLLYLHNTRDDFHARSLLQLRTGIKIKALNVGIGANLDQYGPGKLYKPNYGIFVGWDFL